MNEPGLLWIEFAIPLGSIKVDFQPAGVDASHSGTALSADACHINVLEKVERLLQSCLEKKLARESYVLVYEVFHNRSTMV